MLTLQISVSTSRSSHRGFLGSDVVPDSPPWVRVLHSVFFFPPPLGIVLRSFSGALFHFNWPQPWSFLPLFGWTFPLYWFLNEPKVFFRCLLLDLGFFPSSVLGLATDERVRRTAPLLAVLIGTFDSDTEASFPALPPDKGRLPPLPPQFPHPFCVVAWLKVFLKTLVCYELTLTTFPLVPPSMDAPKRFFFAFGPWLVGGHPFLECFVEVIRSLS